MKKIVFLSVATLFVAGVVLAQKNDIGIKEGLSIYGNSALSPVYEGKYTIQNGTSIDEGFYYTRFFKNGTSDITLNFDHTTRIKNVIITTDPYKIVQDFYRIQVLYHDHWNFNERFSVGLGYGVYYTGWGDETWEYVDNNIKDTMVREGGMDFLGLTINVPVTVLFRVPKKERKVNWNYLTFNFSISADLFSSISNSGLYTASIYCLYGIRF